jgi:hypothetical protein
MVLAAALNHQKRLRRMLAAMEVGKTTELLRELLVVAGCRWIARGRELSTLLCCYSAG